MKTTTEQQIIHLIEKDNLSEEESLQLVDNLYWADWSFLTTKYPTHISNIFNYINNLDHSNKVISQILRLYNNPDGAYVEEFGLAILNLYKKDKTQFIKSLNLEKEEGINLVYIFRNHHVKLDEDKELLSIINSGKLSGDEADTGEKLIKMYENICNT